MEESRAVEQVSAPTADKSQHQSKQLETGVNPTTQQLVKKGRVVESIAEGNPVQETVEKVSAPTDESAELQSSDDYLDFEAAISSGAF